MGIIILISAIVNRERCDIVWRFIKCDKPLFTAICLYMDKLLLVGIKEYFGTRPKVIDL